MLSHVSQGSLDEEDEISSTTPLLHEATPSLIPSANSNLNSSRRNMETTANARASEAAEERRPISPGLSSRATADRQLPRERGSGGQSAPPVEGEEEFTLKYGAKSVVELFAPVSLCMFIVVVSMLSVDSFRSSKVDSLPYTPLRASADAPTGEKIWTSLGNALIVLGVVVLMTIVLVVLYKYRCYKILTGWLVVATFLLLFMFSLFFINTFLQEFDIVTDVITFVIFFWNYGVLGLMVIWWKGPLIVQQFYLICISVFTALIFIKFLADWTAWAIIALIALWDLVAVLCPFGPLRILVNMAQEREENLFAAMIYSSRATIVMAKGGKGKKKKDPKPDGAESSTGGTAAAAGNVGGAGGDRHPVTTNTSNPNQRDESPAIMSEEIISDQATNSARDFDQRHSPPNTADGAGKRARQANRALNGAREATSSPHAAAPEEEEERGVKLGLGDFIFYSLLVGKAAETGDLNTTVACFIAILIGLCFTLVLLAIFKKALPALPISIFFGLIFFFASSTLISPFMATLAVNQVFI